MVKNGKSLENLGSMDGGKSGKFLVVRGVGSSMGEYGRSGKVC